MSSFMNVELYHLYISFKINFLIVPSTKQYIMKSIERNTSVKKEFFWMSSYTNYMNQKIIMKNLLFHCMCLRDILSDVKSNIMKQFTSYIEIWNFFFFWKNTINWDKTFFFGQRMVFYFWLWKYEIFLRRCA